MRLIIVCFFIIGFSSIHAQTTSDLDKRYGFRHFVLNTSPSQYDGQIIEVETWDKNPNINEYKYIGDQIPDFMGTEITNIGLTFYKNKLMAVSVSFGDVKAKNFKEEEFEKILSLVQDLYGKGNPINLDNNNGNMKMVNGRKWVGEKVDLELIRYNYRSVPTHQGYLFLTEKNILQSRRREEF